MSSRTANGSRPESAKCSKDAGLPRRREGEYVMQIVDAQIHLWGTGLPSNLSHRQVTSFTPEEAIALMDEAGVDAAVIHPPRRDPNSHDIAFAAAPGPPRPVPM